MMMGRLAGRRARSNLCKADSAKTDVERGAGERTSHHPKAKEGEAQVQD
jgi:hypothetical protein